MDSSGNGFWKESSLSLPKFLFFVPVCCLKELNRSYFYRDKKLLGTPGIATRSKGRYYRPSFFGLFLAIMRLVRPHQGCSGTVGRRGGHQRGEQIREQEGLPGSFAWERIREKGHFWHFLLRCLSM